MSFAQDSGYLPVPLNTIIGSIRENLNTQFKTTYTEATFLGTNWYKFAYALAQKIQQGEVKASEIFLKTQEYFALTNEAIQRPSVSFPGLFEAFQSHDYVASVKPPAEEDAGKIFICVDVADAIAGKAATGTITISDFAALVSGTDDTITVGATAFTAQAGSATPGDATFQADGSNDATAESLATQINGHATAGALVTAVAEGNVVYLTANERSADGNSIALDYTDNDTNEGAEVSGETLEGGIDIHEDYAGVKLEIATLIKDFVAAGLVTEGTEEEEITISNGQEFTFAYNLPNRIPVLLKLSLTKSSNSLMAVPSDEEIRQVVFDHINARYRLGWNFEPQRYFNLSDAEWSSDCLLEYSVDGGDSWESNVYVAEYVDVFTFGLEDIQVVIS